MANLNNVLNERISRIARKEIKVETGNTRKLALQHRRDIATLKRQIQDLTRRLSFVEAQAKRSMAQQKPSPELAEGARFSPRSVKAQRNRLGLSAEKFGKLFGVTGLTVYSWENGKFRPKKEQLAKLVAVRRMGKREVAKRLELTRG